VVGWLSGLSQPSNHPTKTVKKILVPLDDSKLSESVLPYVCGLAEPLGAEIVLLRVVVFVDQGTGPIPAEYVPSTQVLSELKHYLERQAADMRRIGLTVTKHALGGHVADTIVDYAIEIHADMIAMSTHGRTGAARWLIGSAADKVVHGAKVPVLLVCAGL
jgi:nucleotide-binding universal stress UspA family protein